MLHLSLLTLLPSISSGKFDTQQVVTNPRLLSLCHLLSDKLDVLHRIPEEDNCCNSTSQSPSISPSPSAQPSSKSDIINNAMFKIFTTLGAPTSDFNTGTTYCSWNGVRCNSFLEPKSIEISGQFYGGYIATEIGILEELTSLKLDYNYLEGTVPSELGLLSKLRFLNLSKQFLSSTLPSELQNLNSLEYMYIYANEISGSIPDQIYDFNNLLCLEVFENLLTGTIPESLPPMLDWYLIWDNLLTSTLPDSISTVGEVVDLEENLFTGPIPTSIDLSSAYALVFDDNQLTNTIPSEIGDMLNLEYFSIDANLLTSSIPTEVENLDFTILEKFDIDDNTGLTGTAPSSLCNLGYYFSYDNTNVTCG